VLFLGSLEARLDQINLRFRRLNSGLRLLLEGMQSIYAPGQSDRVDGSIRITGVTFHDLENSRTAEASQWLRIGVLSALLGRIERKANRVLDLFWKRGEVCPGAPDQTTGLMLIEAVI
jgi:hypothetical protein